MSSERWEYHVQMPLDGATPEDLYTGAGWYTVCYPTSPEHAAEVVRIICASSGPVVLRVTSRKISVPN